MKKETVEALRAEFPGKAVFDSGGEVLVELDKDATRSVSVAIIDCGQRHWHETLTEVYAVESGTLELIVDGVTKWLGPGQSYAVQPQCVHLARGNGVRVRLICTPPWTPDDHYVIDESDPKA